MSKSLVSYSSKPDARRSSRKYRYALVGLALLSIPAFANTPFNETAATSNVNWAADEGGHAFGNGLFNWMGNPNPVYRVPNLQPNATWHVSAIKSEKKPMVVAFKAAKSMSGDGDAPAPKAKGKGKSEAKANDGKGWFGAMTRRIVATRPEGGRQSLWVMGEDGSGFGGQWKPLDF